MKVLKGVEKFFLSVVSIPFSVAGAISVGLLTTVFYVLSLPIDVIMDIWGQ